MLFVFAPLNKAWSLNGIVVVRPRIDRMAIVPLKVALACREAAADDGLGDVVTALPPPFGYLRDGKLHAR